MRLLLLVALPIVGYQLGAGLCFLALLADCGLLGFWVLRGAWRTGKRAGAAVKGSVPPELHGAGKQLIRDFVSDPRQAVRGAVHGWDAGSAAGRLRPANPDIAQAYEFVDEMSGEDFESFLAVLFADLGYAVKSTPLSGDFGADLVVCKDGRRGVVQAKRLSSPAGVTAVQEVVAAKAYYGVDEGVVVATSGFTRQAYELARRNRIDLWDRAKLDAAVGELYDADGNPRTVRVASGPDRRALVDWTKVWKGAAGVAGAYFVGDALLGNRHSSRRPSSHRSGVVRKVAVGTFLRH